MLNLTLVAGYGAKPRVFEKLVRDLQARLVELLGVGFTPYSVEQVHGTIVGLEGVHDAGDAINTNFLQLRQERRVMDLARAVALLDESVLPLRIRVGGFGASTDFGFVSRGQHPYERSFSMRGGLATVIGWPAASGGRVRVLDELRRRFDEANVLHKYHATDTDVDDDFYFVLGRIDRARVTDDTIGVAEEAMRKHIAERAPKIIQLESAHLAVVSYEDPKLPRESSRAFALSGAPRQLEEIVALGWA